MFVPEEVIQGEWIFFRTDSCMERAKIKNDKTLQNVSKECVL